MAKTIAPLFSLAASGSLTDALTYSTRKTGSQVRYQRKQHYAASGAQLVQRGYFYIAKNWWHELTSAEKTEWEKEL